MTAGIRSFIAIVIVGLLSHYPVSGQVSIVPEVQANGIVIKQQVFSLMINNLSGSLKKAALYITITDKITSQIIVEANSGIITLNPGVKRFSYQDLAPLTFATSVIGFSDMRQLNQPMPVGEYLICYRLFEVVGSVTKDGLTTECASVYAEPLSPPQLIQPENGSVISDIRPVLSWTPPAPVYMFNSLSYDIIVSPLYEKQSPEEALQRNIPVMSTGSVSNSLAYPSSYTNLEKGQTYVWQVVAKDAGRFGGKSEVWTFRIMPDSVSQIISMAPFVRLKKDNNETTVLHQGILKMEYFNASSDSIAHIQVYRVEEKNNRYKRPLLFDLRVQKGQNFLEYDLNKKSHLDENAVYEVILLNGRKEQWQMRFSPKYYF